MNRHNSYEGVVEDWKVELIRMRAKRLGIRRHDLEDAQQEIVLDVLDFRFDAAKSNGACERTALTSLIDRRLMTMLRAKRRYAQRVHSLPTTTEDGPDEHEPFTEPIPQQQLAMDVREAVDSLSAEEQTICRLLADGESITEIARQLGRSWHTVNRIVGRVRTHFERIGLDGWVNG